MRSLKLLIIDHNELNRQLILRYATKLGHEADLVQDGLSGIDMLVEKEYDLVLLDLEMPIMNGYDTALRIRNLNKSEAKTTPILAFTTQIYPSLQQKIIEIGIDDFILKPVDFNTLESKLKIYSEDYLQSKDILQRNEIDLEFFSFPEYNYIGLKYLIASACGDRSFVIKMISSFVEKTPGYLSLLQKLTEAKKYAELKTLAHKFKATIMILQVDEARKEIETLENNIAKATELENIPYIVNHLCEISNKAITEAQSTLVLLR